AEAPPVAPAVPAPTWSVNPGGLHAQLESWSSKAQYQLVWKAKHDFELETNANFSGDFVSAIKQLFAGLHRGGHALRVTVYQGNNVIEVAED
ncbi:MAG: TcpQ domain-containing protein, partial [Thermodesulfobacteriota bacterium]